MMHGDRSRAILLLGLLFVGIPMLERTFVMPTLGGPVGGGSVGFVRFVPLLVFLVVGFGSYLLVQSDGRRESAETAADPVERLRERYVEGELTEEEFERKLERRLDPADADPPGTVASAEATNRQEESDQRGCGGPVETDRQRSTCRS